MSDTKLFKILPNNKTEEVVGTSTPLERETQKLIENNLFNLIGVRFLQSEYSTDEGRMDTIGIDENNCPVIIEYKRNTSDNVINQGLFYLNWLVNHQKDFWYLVNKVIDEKTADGINWDCPRIICIAGGFNKYDKHAVKEIQHNIELIKYKRYGKDLISFELINTDNKKIISNIRTTDNSSSYHNTKEASECLESSNQDLKDKFEALKDFALSLGDDVVFETCKHYFAFRKIKNFTCIKLKPQKNALTLYINLNPKEENIGDINPQLRDVTNIGHHGTGNLEFTILNQDDLEKAKIYIEKAYNLS